MKSLGLALKIVGYSCIVFLILIILKLSPIGYTNCAHNCGWGGDWFLGALMVGSILSIVPIILVLIGHYLIKKENKRRIDAQSSNNNISKI